MYCLTSGIKVAAVRSAMHTNKLRSGLSRSIPPKIQAPSTLRPWIYLRLPNLNSSISTMVPGPPMGLKSHSRTDTQTSLAKFCQSAMVCWDPMCNSHLMSCGDALWIQRSVSSMSVGTPRCDPANQLSIQIKTLVSVTPRGATLPKSAIGRVSGAVWVSLDLEIWFSVLFTLLPIQINQKPVLPWADTQRKFVWTHPRQIKEEDLFSRLWCHRHFHVFFQSFRMVSKKKNVIAKYCQTMGAGRVTKFTP